MRDPHEKKPIPLDYAPRPVAGVPTYRKVLSAILVLARIALAVMALFESSVPARTNLGVTALTLVGMGFVIRFQHVRLW
jgi:hypothetical protein